MAEAAMAGARSCWSFATASVDGKVKGTLSVFIRILPSPSESDISRSFQESVLRSLRTSSFQRCSGRGHRSVHVNAAVGYPPSMTWWKKGDQPNMREIHSAEEFYDALIKAGNNLVLVDFFSIGCRSCKAIHPKVSQIAAENPDMEVLKVNFHDNKALCRSLNVSILPFFHLYRGSEGRLAAFSCSLPKVHKLREAIAKHRNGCPKITSVVANQNNSLVIPMHPLVALGSTP